ncbi:hypothetical protein SDC9_144494 [bioreactor metagenome]|uniref:Uncharacterized protein n=1 Tax=bioreactor metagenome TaxID=1076179 RepID=A0A645E6Y6_9ZZZZ
MLAQSGIQKPCLCATNAITLGMLPGGAIEQHLLKFFHSTRIDDGDLPVAQSRVALSREQETLDVSLGEGLPIVCGKDHTQVEPLHSR